MPLRPLLILLVPTALAAQTVTLTGTVTNAIVIEARVGTLVNTATQPAGPLPPSNLGQVSIPLGAQGQALLNFGSSLTSNGPALGFGLEAYASSTALGGAAVSTTTGLVDVLLQATASAPVLADLVPERQVASTSGTAMPRLCIDVGDDGSFEITEFVGSSVLGLALGPVPTPIRVQFEAGTIGTQTVSARFGFTLVGSNQLQIRSIYAGCVASQLFVQPSFVGTGVGLTMAPLGAGNLSVAVIGTSVQPIVSPLFVYPGCLLLPAADVLLALPAFTTVEIPLPAAVRPVSLWVQALELDLSGFGQWSGSLLPTPGYRVDAL
jgi:hypothetical protein